MTRTIAIPEAVERYLNERRGDLSDSSHYNHGSQLRQFIAWCEADSDRPDKAGDIDGWQISDFKVHRRDKDELAETSLYNQMSVIRIFVRWCESRDLLEGVSEDMMMPTVDDGTRDTKLDREQGKQILQGLQTYHYATFRHALFALLWSTGMRVGTARSLDISDYNSEEMYVEVVHRPETGTPLKNGEAAERQINLHEWVCVVLDDYLSAHRTDISENARRPLFSTEHGRAQRNTMRKRVRALTRPCEYQNSCPHGREIADCEATKFNKATQCPGSVSPHPLRRSAITNFLNDGHSKELISDRMDVSVDVLEKHYDARSESEKRELRREMFEMD